MKKIESYLPIFNGFYGTIFECDCEESSLPEGKDSDDYEFDYVDYNKRVAEACVEPIQKELKEFGITIEYQKLVSPKFYNYSNDIINVEYTLQNDSFKKIIDYCKENLEAFEQYLEENFKSRDGFSSFFEYDTKTWLYFYLLTPPIDKISTILGSTLEFILQNEEYNTESLYEAITDETNYVGCELKETCE